MPQGASQGLQGMRCCPQSPQQGGQRQRWLSNLPRQGLLGAFNKNRLHRKAGKSHEEGRGGLKALASGKKINLH